MLPFIIVSFCSPHIYVDQSACYKAVEASAHQTGVYQSYDELQKRSEQFAKVYVIKHTGETVWGVAFKTYQVYKSRQLEFRVKNVSAVIEPNKVAMKLKWSF
jgi:hypothetical protein